MAPELAIDPTSSEEDASPTISTNSTHGSTCLAAESHQHHHNSKEQQVLQDECPVQRHHHHYNRRNSKVHFATPMSDNEAENDDTSSQNSSSEGGASSAEAAEGASAAVADEPPLSPLIYPTPGSIIDGNFMFSEPSPHPEKNNHLPSDTDKIITLTAPPTVTNADQAVVEEIFKRKQRHGPDILMRTDSVHILKNVSVRFLSTYTVVFLFVILCSTNLFLACVASIIAPFFPREAIIKGGSLTDAGIVMSSYDAARFVTAPLICLVVHKIGARFLLIAGPFLVFGSTILFGALGMAPANKWFFIFASFSRMLAGVGAAAYVVTSIAIQPILFHKYSGSALGTLRAVSIVGVIIGPAVGGLLYSFGGYCMPFWILGSVAVLLAITQMIITPDLSDITTQQQAENEAKEQQQIAKDKMNGQKPQKEATLFGLWRHKSMLYCFFANTSVGFTVMFYNSSISLQILPLVNDVPTVGYIMLTSAFAEILVAPFAGYLLDRYLPGQLSLTIHYVISAAALLLLGPSPLAPYIRKSLPLMLVGIAILGTGLAFGFSAPFKLANEEAKKLGYARNQKTHSVVAGSLITSQTFGGFLGPVVGGILQDNLGFPWASTLVAGLLLVFAIGSLVYYLFLYAAENKLRKLKKLDAIP